MILIIFWGLGIDTSAANFGLFFGTSILLNFTSVSLGYFVGVCFDDDFSARLLLVFMMLYFMLTAGVFSNAASFPAFIGYLSYLSPMRYTCELYFRSMLKSDNALYNEYIEPVILNEIGFTWGVQSCLLAMVGFIVFFQIGAYVIINLKNRKL